MDKHEVKILSYIGNFKKVIFICPLCRENNSLMLKDASQREVEFRCDGCRQKYIADLKQLNAIIDTL